MPVSGLRSLRRLVCLVVLGLASPLTRAAEFPDAAQPQLAASGDRVFLAFGRGPELFVARSDDAGASFAPPVRVAALPSLMLGRRRGPRLVAHGDRVTVAVIAGELLAFHSADGGRTWKGPALVNDVPRSAREGLHALAVAPDGRLFATWLDLRDVANARTQLFGSESSDGGATWSTNRVVYRAPAGQTACECCHPSAVFNAQGDLAVMWRNGLDGCRDLWLSVRSAGTDTFAAANKLGAESWRLAGCPMDGGSVVPAADGSFFTAWMRAGNIFTCAPGQPEVRLAAGTQPVATAAAIVWQEGPALRGQALAPGAAPVTVAPQGRFASLLARPAPASALVAYERGSAVVVAPLAVP